MDSLEQEKAKIGPDPSDTAAIRISDLPPYQEVNLPSATRGMAYPETFLRRLIDIVASGAGLVAFSPLFGVIAVAIKIGDGGPVFFTHTRVGRNGRRFGLLKFRTMVANADRMGSPITVAGDWRVTRIGRFLRKYKLDELPQLVNVLRGEMSLVGPRPEAECFVALYQAEFGLLLLDRPGITDPASVEFRDEESLLLGADAERIYKDEILPRKLELAMRYQEKRTLLSDFKILWQTFSQVLRISK